MRRPFASSSRFSLHRGSGFGLKALFCAIALSSSLYALRPALAFEENDGSLFNVPGEGPPYVARYAPRAGWPPMPARRPNIFRNSSFDHQVERPIYEEDIPHAPYKKARRHAPHRYAEPETAEPEAYEAEDDLKYARRAPYRDRADYARVEKDEAEYFTAPLKYGDGGKYDDDGAGFGGKGSGFGRLFPKGRVHYENRDLAALGRAMIEEERSGYGGGVSETPSGYTFFGQFIDHDITFDTTTQLGREIEGDYQLENARTPALDLDSVYAGGPGRTPHLYRVPYIRIGRVISDEHEALRADLFRTKSAHHYGPAGGEAVALVGDPRNDENIIISQLHAAFVAFHNRTADILIERDYGRDRWNYCKSGGQCDTQELAEALPDDAKRRVFETAQDHVIHYYHRLIVEDFLPWVIGPERTISLLKHGRDFFYPNGFRDEHGQFPPANIPVEFAAAAFRYGHSQVNEAYTLREGTLFDLLTDGRDGPRAFHPVTPRYLIDWRYFFDIGSHRPERFNFARRIDPELVRSLHQLHISNAVGKQDLSSLAARNLIRGKTLHLPSGQEVAERILPLLAERGLLEGGYGKEARGYNEGWRSYLLRPDDRVKYFLGETETPLWYYILQEASLFGARTNLDAPQNQDEEYLSDGDYGPRRGRGGFRYASAKYGDGGKHRYDGDGGADGGHRLGPVGATIVGEVLTGLLDQYREKTGKGLAYQPQIKGSITEYDAYGKHGGKGRYLMRNFLIDAGVAEAD